MLVTKNEIPNQIIFAVVILGGIMYSTVNVILKVKWKRNIVLEH